MVDDRRTHTVQLGCGTLILIALMTRGLNRRERDTCAFAGDGKLVATLIGRRAVLAMTIGSRFGLTPELLYRALARDILGTDGRFAANTVMRWHELDPALVCRHCGAEVDPGDLTVRVLTPGWTRQGPERTPDPAQATPSQSSVLTHALPTAHGMQVPPPQSASVSSALKPSS